MTSTTPPAPRAPRPVVDQLAEQLGVDWPHLQRARQLSEEKRQELRDQLMGHDTDDTTIVVFGSLARNEFTDGSDIDWTFLVDGSADPQHQDVVHEISRHVHKVEGRPAGREGTFGTLTFSHDLIHLIGGEDDTNKNTTKRILLLLESCPIGSMDAYRRVLSNVLRRYLEEDRGIWYGSGQYKVPRFLLNDIVRYWRTMTVDFEYKQRSRAGKGFAIRNLKLRMSRKLIFVAGLLTCFSTQTELSQEERAEIFADDRQRGQSVLRLVSHLRKQMGPPVEVLARTVLERPGLHDAARELFSAYDEFVGMLSDPEQRGDLESLTDDLLEGSALFDRGKHIGRRFQSALDRIFLEQGSPFYGLTLKYGVF